MSKITITPEQLKQAKGIAKDLGAPLYMNSKGEFFTNDNHALFSEGGNKDNVLELTAETLADVQEAKGSEASAELQEAKKELGKARAALTNASKKLEKADDAGRAAAQEAVDAAQEAVKQAEAAYVAAGGTIL